MVSCKGQVHDGGLTVKEATWERMEPVGPHALLMVYGTVDSYLLLILEYNTVKDGLKFSMCTLQNTLG